VPIPFLILFGSVVLAANMAGLKAGLISATIATAYITYSASISFGPPTLTGGPFQLLLGALVHFVAAFFLGQTKSQDGFLIEQLQTYGESLEKLVESQTGELREANQSLQQEIAEHKRTEEALAQSLTQIERIKQEWEATADSLPELVCLLDNQTHIIRANRTVERWGLKSVLVVKGLAMHDLLHPECTDPACYQRGFWSQAWAKLKQNQPIEMEIQDELLNRHLHLEVRPIESKTGQHPKADSSWAIVIIQDITERKQIERALRESEARYRAIVEDQTELVSRKTPDGTLTFVNEAYCRQFGKTREALLGANYFNLLIEEDRQAIREKLASLSPENPVIVDEHREYRPDSSLAWFQWMGRGIFDETGQLIEVQSVGRDITERKEAEEALQESEARFQRLAEAAFEGIRISDQGTIVDINDQAGQMFGYEPAEMIGMSALDFVAPESRSLVQKNIMSQSDGPYEYMALRKDSSTFPVEVRVRAFPYKGRMFRIGVIRDMTKYKEAEEALRQSEERFSRAFHLNPSAIAISTIEDIRYLDVNASFLKFTGYRREEVVGHTPLELNLLMDAEGQDRILQALQEDGQVLNQEIPVRTKSGETRLALASFAMIELDPEPYILGMCIDITERKQLEEQLLQRQKLEAISQLAAGIAHDFNNRLLVINGLAEKIGLDLTSDDPHQELLNQIIQSGQQATDLVRQLLAFSRKQIIEPKVLNLNTIVTDMNKMLQSAIGENIELETKLEQDLWPIKVDPSQIEQIIVNLALNARDAMPDGGRLTIETSQVILDDDYVAHHLGSQPGEHILLVVSDTGHGISEEIKSHIFDPFFTTKEQSKGTGLGLASIYGIVKQNRGNIWVDSKEGVGTTFKIYLPREKEMIPSVPSQSEDEIKAIPGTETILLVEDDSAVRYLIHQALTAQGYTLLEAQNGSEVLQLAAEYKSTIHLLLTDIIMPGMKGTVLAEKLIQLKPGLKVLFMTGYADSVALDHIQGSSINLLQKPFNPTTLARKVREILDS